MHVAAHHWHVPTVPAVQGKDEVGKPISDYWKPSLGLLNDKDFLSRLKSYDKDNILPR